METLHDKLLAMCKPLEDVGFEPDDCHWCYFNDHFANQLYVIWAKPHTIKVAIMAVLHERVLYLMPWGGLAWSFSELQSRWEPELIHKDIQRFAEEVKLRSEEARRGV